MRLNGFNQHLAMFAAPAVDRAMVTVSSRSSETRDPVHETADLGAERDRALFALSQRITGRVADGLETTPDV